MVTSRDLAKRLYNVHPISKGWFIPPKNDGFVGHFIGGASNGSVDLRFMSFWQYFWEGENLNGVIDQWQTYIGHITPEVFRSYYMGHNYGFPVMFLGQGRVKREWAEAHGGCELAFDHLAGLALLHDMGGNVHCHAVGPDGVAAWRRWWETIDGLDFNHWVHQFVPYWHQDIVKMPRPDMYASFYIGEPSKLVGATDAAIDAYFEKWQPRLLPDSIKARIRQEVKEQRPPWRKRLEEMPDRAFLIVYNHSDWAGEVRLDVDWAKLPSRKTFFDDVRALLRYLCFPSWEALMDFMMRGLEIGPYAVVES